MRHFIHLAALAACLTACAAARAQERGEFALTEKSAYVVLPQQYVTGPAVLSADWSGDGRFMLIQTTAIRLDAATLRRAMAGGPGGGAVAGETRLVVWAAKDAATQVVWRSAIPGAFAEAHWLPDSTVALVLLRNVSSGQPTPAGAPPDLRDILLRIDGPTGSARVLVRGEPQESLTLSPSAFEPVAVLRRTLVNVREQAGPDGKPGLTAEMRETLRIVRSDGAMGNPLPVPSDIRVTETSWLGRDKLGLHCVEAKRQPGAKRAERLCVMDVRSGAIQQVEKLPAPQQVVADERPIGVRHDAAKLVAGPVSRAVRPVWLVGLAQGKEAPALVAADATWSSLSPRGDAVAYQSGGSLYVCPLMEISRSEFEAARDAARRTMALSNAKQCGLAVLMYSQDHDEKLPGQGEDIGGMLSTYLKDNGPLEGFVYTFGGGSLSGVQSPAETEMGYVPGPGGRAIVYVDGHAKWRPDKQP